MSVSNFNPQTPLSLPTQMFNMLHLCAPTNDQVPPLASTLKNDVGVVIHLTWSFDLVHYQQFPRLNVFHL